MIRIAETIKNIINAIFRGELLLRIGVDKYFTHIIIVLTLLVAHVLIGISTQNTLAKVEKNRKEIENLKIHYAQKESELIGMDRISTLESLLKSKGSKVGLPLKPAVRIDAKEN